MHPRTVYGIRCNKYTKDTNELYSLLCKIHKEENVFLICDESKNQVTPPPTAKKISITENKITSLGLPLLKNWGWQCGDFFYYAFSESVPSDYYWLIEPDVVFGGEICEHFFRSLEKIEYDFLAFRHEPRDNSWYWHRTISNYTTSVFGCAFPITRLSRKPIEFLLENRKKNLPFTSIPNDEAFVSTFLEAGGYSCIAIENIFPDLFKHFSTSTPLLKERFIKIAGVHHPALSWEEFKDKYPEKLKQAISIKNGARFVRSTLYGVAHEKIFLLMEEYPELFFEAFLQSKK